MSGGEIPRTHRPQKCHLLYIRVLASPHFTVQRLLTCLSLRELFSDPLAHKPV